jgi:hypothetical protein
LIHGGHSGLTLEDLACLYRDTNHLQTATLTEVVSEHLRSLLDILKHGQLFWFAKWLAAAVPRSGALRIHGPEPSGQFIYIGMAGRGETSAAPRARTVRPLEQSRQRAPHPASA